MVAKVTGDRDPSDGWEVWTGSEGLIVRIQAVVGHLEYLDCGHVDWHIERGLPKLFKQRRDLLAISSRHKEAKGYWQEHHEMGFRRDGYGSA
jgi:hypothetical protein